MSWLRRLWARPVEFVPTATQLERRLALAQAIRMWMERESELLNESTIIETMYGDWQKPLNTDQNEARDKLFEDAYHHLQHFFFDADIRAKDIEYAKIQRNTLQNCIRKLEAEQS